jgi:hypothetical protein
MAKTLEFPALGLFYVDHSSPDIEARYVMNKPSSSRDFY